MADDRTAAEEEPAAEEAPPLLIQMPVDVRNLAITVIAFLVLVTLPYAHRAD